MSTTIQGTGRQVALDQIRVPENVRALDRAHVDALAGSIKLQGILVPVVVRDDGDGYELVAGFHRIAAARALGLAEVPVVVRDVQTEDADRAVENITRKQLNPYEEAKAVKAMLDRGLTEDGAAQALGWPKNRVTARLKILELPERAQQLIGEDVIHLAALDQLRAIGTVAPDLLDAVIAYLDDGNAWAAERLTREPGWVLTPPSRTGATARCSPPTCTQRARTRSPSCGLARRRSSSTRRPRVCTSRSTATPTARRRSASTTPTSTRRAPPAC